MALPQRPDQIENTEALEAQKNAPGNIEQGEVAQARETARATEKVAQEKLALTTETLYGEDGSLAKLQSPPLSQDQNEEMQTRLQRIEADIPEVDDTSLLSSSKEVRNIAANHLGLVDENAADRADMDGSVDDPTNNVGAI